MLSLKADGNWVDENMTEIMTTVDHEICEKLRDSVQAYDVRCHPNVSSTKVCGKKVDITL